MDSALNAPKEQKHWLSIKHLIDLYPKRGMTSTQILSIINNVQRTANLQNILS